MTGKSVVGDKKPIRLSCLLLMSVSASDFQYATLGFCGVEFCLLLQKYKSHNLYFTLFLTDCPENETKMHEKRGQ